MLIAYKKWMLIYSKYIANDTFYSQIRKSFSDPKQYALICRLDTRRLFYLSVCWQDYAKS